jgi:hypothetical protein
MIKDDTLLWKKNMILYLKNGDEFCLIKCEKDLISILSKKI